MIMETVEEVKFDEDVIFTPHFRSDRYLYHVCGGCGYHVAIQQSYFSHFDFGETFKFCPNCGKPVCRFAQLPVFEEPPVNRKLFEPVEKIYENAVDRIKYYLYITMTDAERKQLVAKAEFAQQLEEAGGEKVPDGARLVLEYGYGKLTQWDKKRLKEMISDDKD